MGSFLSYLDANGMIKEKGVAYTHHHPGKAERAHQTILRQARAMLLESLLPPKFYDEAQRTAAYIFNRTVHGKDVKTPYEMMLNKKPDIRHLKLPRVHSTGKTVQMGLKRRERLLGYGDDLSLEEMEAYKLRKEYSGTILCSDNCTFDREPKMERLADIFYSPENDATLMDSLWTETSGEVNDDRDMDSSLDPDERLRNEESSNLVKHLMVDR